MKKNYNWGILGPGKIAHRFAEALQRVPSASLYCVASRNKERATEFATKYSIPVVHENYESLVKDPEVDIIYISTPHSFHQEQAVMCLENNKPVLCEKPLSVNYKSTQKIVIAARSNKTFLMEAMWTRFMPATLKVQELIREGKIGDIKYIRGDFGDRFPFDPTSRVYDLKLGAGSILDIGIYPLFLILLILGRPDEIKSFAHLAETGADDLASAMLCYRDGKIATILSSNILHTPITAEIMGTEGIITMHSNWYNTKSVSLSKMGKETQYFDVSYDGNGFEFQIQEVMNCVGRGEKESTLMPLDFTLLLSKTMDEICHQCGVIYPEQ
ncbi:MAG: dehydrogenase [Marivirga sp.]|nr:dehydrogenase [Marivirga sp.]